MHYYTHDCACDCRVSDPYVVDYDYECDEAVRKGCRDGDLHAVKENFCDMSKNHLYFMEVAGIHGNIEIFKYIEGETKNSDEFIPDRVIKDCIDDEHQDMLQYILGRYKIRDVFNVFDNASCSYNWGSLCMLTDYMRGLPPSILGRAAESFFLIVDMLLKALDYVDDTLEYSEDYDAYHSLIKLKHAAMGAMDALD